MRLWRRAQCAWRSVSGCFINADCRAVNGARVGKPEVAYHLSGQAEELVVDPLGDFAEISLGKGWLLRAGDEADSVGGAEGHTPVASTDLICSCTWVRG